MAQQQQQQHSAHSTLSMMTNKIEIRPMQPQDAEQIAKIWKDGLDQTIDSLCSGIFAVFRPLAVLLTKWAAQVALGKYGDIGPNGSNLLHRWGKDENADRCMLVAVVEPDAPLSASSLTTISSSSSISDGMNSNRMLVGCVGVKRHDDSKTIKTTTWASILRMSVHTDYRRSGVGTQLLQAAEDWAQYRLQCQSMMLVTINPVAAQFYRQQGYQPASGFRIFHYIKSLEQQTLAASSTTTTTQPPPPPATKMD